jgi:hypothetical protein
MDAIRALATLVAIGFLPALVPAQVLLHETFSGSPAGWLFTPQWQIGPISPNPSGCQGSNGTDPVVDADGKSGGGVAGDGIGTCSSASPTTPYDDQIWSPAIDVGGLAHVRLEFDSWLNIQGAFWSHVYVQVYDGFTYTTVWTETNPSLSTSWTHHVVDISGLANSAVSIGFLYHRQLTSIPYAGWCIDNVRVTAGEIFHERFCNNAAGWTLGPQWGIGNATGSSGCATDVGFYNDPAIDGDGVLHGGVAGAVIGGCLGGPAHGQYYLTSPPINTANANLLRLSFDRWLNSDYDPYMNSVVEVFDGTGWAGVFGTPCCAFIADSSWVRVTYDVSAYKNPAFRVRFGFDNAAAAYNVSGWNVDNVSIYDLAGCGLSISQPSGPTSVKIRVHCLSATLPPGTALFNCFTTTAGNFPNGWFFGIAPNLANDVIPQFLSGVPPFRGVTDANGEMSWQLPAGSVPPTFHVWGVTLALSPSGQVLANTAPVAAVLW